MALGRVGGRGRLSLSRDPATPAASGRSGAATAGRLRAFLNDPELGASAASRVLRGAFLSFFAGQAAAALLVALVLGLVAGVRPRPTPWVGATVVGASLVQLLMGLAVATGGVRAATAAARRLAQERAEATARAAPGHGGARSEGGAAAATEDADAGVGAAGDRRALAERLRAARASALWATVMAAVLLSTPSWFAAFAWLSGNRGIALLAVLALLAVGYAFGFVQLGALARGVGARRTPAAGGADAAPPA